MSEEQTPSRDLVAGQKALWSLLPTLMVASLKKGNRHKNVMDTIRTIPSTEEIADLVALRSCESCTRCETHAVPSATTS